MAEVPEIPGITEVIVDDYTVLDGSDALVGIRIVEGGQSTQCEVFFPPREDYGNDDERRYIEVYPLNGQDEPFVAELKPYSLSDEAITGAVKKALYQRAQNPDLN